MHRDSEPIHPARALAVHRRPHGRLPAVSRVSAVACAASPLLRPFSDRGALRRIACEHLNVPNVGRVLFGELRFRGLNQNRPVNELTDQEIRSSFEGSPYNLSNHSVMRFRDIRMQSNGIRTLNDIANVFNNGVIEASTGTTVTITWRGAQAVVDVATRNVVTFKPSNN